MGGERRARGHRSLKDPRALSETVTGVERSKTVTNGWRSVPVGWETLLSKGETSTKS